MARLIDADKLLKHKTDHEMISTHLIYNAPTVDAQPTTKNDLGVDAISRSDVLKLMHDNWHTHNGDWAMQESMDDIRALPSVTPQEPFKPMVEIDLYSVIKQKYIEREVLDKIRAEIEQTAKDYDKFEDYRRVRGLWIALEIIDKYKAETEQ